MNKKTYFILGLSAIIGGNLNATIRGTQSWDEADWGHYEDLDTGYLSMHRRNSESELDRHIARMIALENDDDAKKRRNEFRAKLDFFKGGKINFGFDPRGAAALKNGYALSALLREANYTRGISSQEDQVNRLGGGGIVSASFPVLKDREKNEKLIENFHKALRNEINERYIEPALRGSETYERGGELVNSSPLINNLPNLRDLALQREITDALYDLLERARRTGFISQIGTVLDFAAHQCDAKFEAGQFITKSDGSIDDKVSKLLNDPHQNASLIAKSFDDLMRGTIIVKNYSGVRSVIEGIKSLFPRVRFDNKYGNAKYAGYVGIHAYIPLNFDSHGQEYQILYELQIHTKDEMKAKSRTHKAYEVARNCRQNNAREVRLQQEAWFADAIVYCDAMISGLGYKQEQIETMAYRVRKDTLNPSRNYDAGYYTTQKTR